MLIYQNVRLPIDSWTSLRIRKISFEAMKTEMAIDFKICCSPLMSIILSNSILRLSKSRHNLFIIHYRRLEGARKREMEKLKDQYPVKECGSFEPLRPPMTKLPTELSSTTCTINEKRTSLFSNPFIRNSHNISFTANEIKHKTPL